ncbi:MAG: hypothetical protein FJ265_15570 [Planctomycetes bacterium]|nr:hypothetical protein [Planctomycetota bacterium]
MRRPRTLPIVAAALLAGACARRPVHGPSFDVLRTSPPVGPGSAPLLLNDTLTVYFSEPVSPLSVTSDAVTVVDEEGHQVPGTLRVGSTWVGFEPRPPFTAGLDDGSFLPDRSYRLLVAGYPRPDALRSAAGRRLAAAHAFEFRTAATVPGRAPLRPLATGLPFLLRNYDAPQSLPADAPRLRLHFTLPVLPGSATADSVCVQWLGTVNPVPIQPRSVRIVPSRLDEFPGSTVEVDLGPVPQLEGMPGRPLRAGDLITVSVRSVRAPLCDYAGNPVVATVDPFWTVVPGTSVALVAWPARDGGIAGDDPLLPGFESLSGLVRPRSRLEAGDGSLGVFRPRRDTVLRPGVPFDRGDGVEVQSRGAVFPFLAIDVPAGVTVRVDGGSSPVQLLACGGIRVDGTLVLAGPTVPLQVPRPGTAVQDLLEAAPVALLAAGDVTVRGRIETAAAVPPQHSPLTLASAGRIHLFQELPYHTILAVEQAQMEPAELAIVGLRGQVEATAAAFTYGVPPGARWIATGNSPWSVLPLDRDGGRLCVLGPSGGIRVRWQVALPDAVRKGEPDLTPARVGRPEAANDQDWVEAGAGSYVRFLLDGEVAAAAPLPSVREIRLVDR